MTSSLSAAQRRACPEWSFRVSGSVRELSLARESGAIFLMDESGWLHLLNARGQPQAKVRAPDDFSSLAQSDDGSALTLGTRKGEIWWLNHHLTPCWQQKLPAGVEGMALDSLGQYLAVTDSASGFHLFNARGKIIWKTRTPLALRFLSFIPEAPFLLGSAHYGLILCLDGKGEVVWRDGPVAHLGSLTTSGDGKTILLAGFGDGLYRLDRSGPPAQVIRLEAACRLVTISYDGNLILTTGMTAEIRLLDAEHRVCGQHTLSAPATTLALSPLGERSILGTADGHIVSVLWRP